MSLKICLRGSFGGLDELERIAKERGIAFNREAPLDAVDGILLQQAEELKKVPTITSRRASSHI